ncbi:MAG: hydrogenase maturation nickel metallochaperone HypA [Desulfobulbaceae bacterium]|nr:hydrogenase maturation nickel metallochaperone HypA [Desulfobulbaceae bacterium]
MHEMSIAMSIIDIALSEAEKAGAQTIDEIEVEVGQLAAVMLESLRFCLEAAAKGTLTETATFTLINIPGHGHCLACQRDVAITEFPAQCDVCQGFGVSITAGTELKIRSISINGDNNGREE